MYQCIILKVEIDESWHYTNLQVQRQANGEDKRVINKVNTDSLSPLSTSIKELCIVLYTIKVKVCITHCYLSTAKPSADILRSVLHEECHGISFLILILHQKVSNTVRVFVHLRKVGIIISKENDQKCMIFLVLGAVCFQFWWKVLSTSQFEHCFWYILHNVQ